MSEINKFSFEKGKVLSKKYEIEQPLGLGWEAEVYLVSEVQTKIQRAVKVFYPHRNINNKVLNNYAKKLHKLKDCELLIQYIGQESFRHKGETIHYMVSDYIDYLPLDQWLNQQPKKFVPQFEGLHILYVLAKGIESIHRKREFHGDIHTSNILIERYGLSFNIKILDFYNHNIKKSDLIKHDIIDLINVFYEILGGSKRYQKLKPEIRNIIKGRKKSLILHQFPKIADLRTYLESMLWNQ